MSDYRRIALLILIMTVVSAGVGVVAIMILYETAFEQQRARLVETAQSQARLLEAVARFDLIHSIDYPAGAQAATIDQIMDAHEHYQGFGDTGEFTLARRVGNDIVFVLRHRHSNLDTPDPIPFDSDLAEPMRLALSGRSGTVIGMDYRGATVLAAYEPVSVLDLGIVAKIDLVEIRAPFLKAGSVVGGVALVLVLAGTMLFFRVGNPIVQRVRESEQRLKTILDTLTSVVFLKDPEGRHILINPQYEVATGLTRTQVLGKTDNDFLSKDVADRLRVADQEALAAGKSVQCEETLPGPEGMRHYVTTRVPVKDASGRLQGLFGIATDITDRMRAEEALKARVRQQAAVADLGRHALAGADLGALCRESVVQVAQRLGVECAKVLEILPDGERMLLRAGVGWKEGCVGKATVSAGRESQAGFTLLEKEPVVVDDLRTETRFSGPALLHDHGVVSGVSVIIQGKDRPFGVLGAHTRRQHSFSADDINFLRAVANVLAETAERGQAEAALQRAHDELEMRVKERTSDLVAANLSLQQEVYARQEAEEALRASEQRYAKAAEIADFGYWERDFSRSTAIWSDEAYRIFGLDLEQFDGAYESFLRIVHPDDREQLERAVDNAIRHGEPLDTEYRILRENGSERVIHSVAEPRLGQSGQPVGLHGVVHDITERKRTEQELRRSLGDQEIVASILRISLRPIPLSEMLEQTLTLLLTKHERWLETQGCIFLVEGKNRELVMKVTQGLPASIEASCSRVEFGRCICGRAAEDQRLLHVDKVDARHELSYAGMSPHGHYCAPIQSEGEVLGVLNLYLPEGHQSSEPEERFVTAVADTLAGIIRRKRAEEALAKTQAGYEDLYDNAPDMFASVDATTGTITQCNKTLADALGYSKERLIGQPVSQVYDPDSLTGVPWAEEAFTETGEVRNAELRLQRKDGTRIDVSLNVTAVRDEDGKILYSRAAWRDITERKRAEQQAREHEAQVAHVARLSTVGEMATGIAHEINQPLTAMVTYSQACLRMMGSGNADQDKLRGAIEQVTAQGLRAGEIIRRLREFTRMRETKRTAVDLNTLVREAVRFVEAEAREEGIDIRLDLAGHLPDVIADTIQIEQVILNLLRNAIDAMGASETQQVLTVKTGRKNTGKVELLVRDTGPGLAEAMMDRIFEPFVTTKSQGMGMGLSISRSIIEAHHGQLWADTPDTRGAVFHFVLPAASKGDGVEH